MLAQNFKTATDLGITERLHDRLVQVLGMFERQEVPDHLFSMTRVGAPECGTPGCIMGWVRHGDRSLDMDLDAALENSEEFNKLCYPYQAPQAWLAGRAEATIALRSYLTTGEERWSDALAAV